MKNKLDHLHKEFVTGKPDEKHMSAVGACSQPLFSVLLILREEFAKSAYMKAQLEKKKSMGGLGTFSVIMKL